MKKARQKKRYCESCGITLLLVEQRECRSCQPPPPPPLKLEVQDSATPKTCRCAHCRALAASK